MNFKNSVTQNNRNPVALARIDYLIGEITSKLESLSNHYHHLSSDNNLIESKLAAVNDELTEILSTQNKKTPDLVLTRLPHELQLNVFQLLPIITCLPFTKLASTATAANIRSYHDVSILGMACIGPTLNQSTAYFTPWFKGSVGRSKVASDSPITISTIKSHPSTHPLGFSKASGIGEDDSKTNHRDRGITFDISQNQEMEFLIGMKLKYVKSLSFLFVGGNSFKYQAVDFKELMTNKFRYFTIAANYPNIDMWFIFDNVLLNRGAFSFLCEMMDRPTLKGVWFQKSYVNEPPPTVLRSNFPIDSFVPEDMRASFETQTNDSRLYDFHDIGCQCEICCRSMVVDRKHYILEVAGNFNFYRMGERISEKAGGVEELSMKSMGIFGLSENLDCRFFQSLKSLDLSNNQLHHIDMSVFSNLEILCLNSNAFDGFNDLQNLQNCWKLREFHLMANRLTGSSVFDEAPVMNNVRILNLNHNRISAWDSLESKFPNLETLWMVSNGLGEGLSMKEDVLGLKLRNLQELNIGENCLPRVFHLQGSLPRLKILDLSNNIQTSSLMEYPGNSLQILRMSNCLVRDLGWLAHIPLKYSQIRHLNFQSNRIRSVESNLEHLSLLNSIDLSYNLLLNIGDFQFVGNTNLLKVDVTGNPQLKKSAIQQCRWLM
ncbi:hypothetical protein DASC09_002780 [Saccharomycopsis crataegensis]|uniref:F-box domain-containing protein n=1 Tax=Saccharomycopsis crataegensis TaxID=43959 RepID=A0AAV5QFI8_9ASCO|nr:hypothetical protein DASC09_002780 [Saccharomycopsis crataegensis]